MTTNLKLYIILSNSDGCFVEGDTPQELIDLINNENYVHAEFHDKNTGLTWFLNNPISRFYESNANFDKRMDHLRFVYASRGLNSLYQELTNTQS